MKNYSLVTKILHKQFLSKNEFTKFLINRIIDKSKEINLENYEYIFITGLARSGTTSLLQSISELNEFGSLRYKYMPFILSPKIAQIYNKNFYKPNFSSYERMHEDGLKISLEAAECLDEPYWIQSISKITKDKGIMEPHFIRKNIAKGYLYLLDNFRRIENKKRLIIKNNNNHLRIKYLSKLFPNSKFLVVFRSPLSHARSLLKVHKKLSEKQSADKFILEYMNLLGHWEFGKGKKPFIYKKGQLNVLNGLSDSKIDYWLEQWIFTYEWILEVISANRNKNIYLICYEDLCNSTKYESALFNKLNINQAKGKFKFKVGQSNLENKNEISNGRTKYAFQIYSILRKKSFLDFDISNKQVDSNLFS